MEQLLHYVWKYKLYSPLSLRTISGNFIEIIDVGVSNKDAGPDFFNAKIKINGIVWAGSVEIHNKASDWFKHGHQVDKAYDTVILHVVEISDVEIRRTDGTLIEQLVLPILDKIKENIDWLLHRDASVPCLPFLKEMPSFYIHSWMDTLLSERLQRKTEDILRFYELLNHDWNEVFYVSLTRSFGFGINNDAFEQLARSLPFAYIRKQRGSQTQIEAMLFGQAGLLIDEKSCSYYRLLQREYEFLAHKFSLKRPTALLFKNMRLRPKNQPCLKIAQLASIWYLYDTIFSLILEANTPGEIKKLFKVRAGDYWSRHYNFEHETTVYETMISDHAVGILIINTVAPMFFAYAQLQKRPEFANKALRLLESVAPERNHITDMFAKEGVVCCNAADSQALIQLKREYCEKKKCLYCRLGYRMLKQQL